MLCNYEQCPNLDEEYFRLTGRQRHRQAIGGGKGRCPKRDDVLKIPPRLIDYMCGFQNDAKESVEAHGDWQRVESKRLQNPRQGMSERPDGAARRVREVQMLPWQVQPRRPFRIGRIEHRGGRTQLLMEVTATCGAVSRKLRALVDTGAEANLIRHDIFPKDCFRPAREPLALSTVNGNALPGGRNEVQLRIKFIAETSSGEPVPQGWTTSVWFHDADIGSDAILSYEWMARHRINVLPWGDALQLNEAPRWILKSAPLHLFPSDPQLHISTVRMQVSDPQRAMDEVSEDEGLECAIMINQVRKLQLRLVVEVD